ncbi:MAG: RNA ligase partner protein [Nitrospirales bacterium]|nr:RNA ligase partner protein [Nitrospirales bacterium]
MKAAGNGSEKKKAEGGASVQSTGQSVRLTSGEAFLKKRTGKAKKVVLDTSLFVNPDVRANLGETPTAALETFLTFAARIHILEFYMPPSIFEELLHFVERDRIPGDLLVNLYQKPPKKHELSCPAFLLYELIEDMRERVNKGLRLAEKAVRGAESRKAEEMIPDLRKKYREALREGIIDSKEDVDLLLLAMELDALLITADQGLVKWAEKLGIKWLFPEKFRDYLLGAIRRSELLSERKEK